MKKAIIIQARMGSSRLPGKVMMDLAGKPVLQRMIERCQASTTKDVIITTTTKTRDNAIIELCKKLGTPFFRGSEQNVLERTYETAKAFNVDLVIDITSDCPLVDPDIINNLVFLYTSPDSTVDYVSNVIKRSFPIGFDAQVYSFQALGKLYKMSKIDKRIIVEHSGWNFTQLKEFRKYSWTPKSEYFYPDWRLTLDTQKDYELINWLYSVMREEIWDYKRIIDFLKNNWPYFLSYNSITRVNQ
jgi:spore coat polysaccharide biosynthesis protein SpsF